MLRVSPGDLITKLVLVDRHGSTVLILSAKRHPAGNCGAGCLADGYARENINAGPQVGYTSLRIFEWSQDGVIYGVTLICRVHFVHQVGRHNRRESQEGGL